jgi:DNA-binding NarL/FixJ family response regulator
MSEQLMKQVINAVTGESSVIPFTDDEMIAHKKMQDEYVQQKAEADAKVAARESALAKLAKLGLTADEVAAL